MKDDAKLIFESYITSKTIKEDANDQYAPEEAPEDDTLEMQPFEDEESNLDVEKIEKALNAIVDQLKLLNQYADFMATGKRASGFTTAVQKDN